jgi:hypothetical protein
VGNACVKRGGIARLLGFFSSLVLGGGCIGVGYWLAYIGYEDWEGLELHQVTYPVAGWFGMVFGGLIGVGGSMRCLTATKEEVEGEEELERLKEEVKRQEELEELKREKTRRLSHPDTNSTKGGRKGFLRSFLGLFIDFED